MRGHVQQRGADSWRLKVFIGRSGDGKRRYVERTFRGSRAEADVALARLVVEAADGRYVPAAPMSYGDLLDRWLAVKRMTVEPSTIRNYEWVAARYIRPVLGSRGLASLRPVDLDQLYTNLHGWGLSPRTVRICHTVLRQSLEQARRWGLIARSPAVDATPPRQLRKEVTPPTIDEVRRLLDAALTDDPDFGTYLWVLASTGCRRGEACAIRWTDVDVDSGELRIRRAIAMDADGQPYVKDTKTHQSRRLALDEATVARLKAHRRRARERALALGVHLAADAYLFADARVARGAPTSAPTASAASASSSASSRFACTT